MTLPSQNKSENCTVSIFFRGVSLIEPVMPRKKNFIYCCWQWWSKRYKFGLGRCAGMWRLHDHWLEKHKVSTESFRQTDKHVLSCLSDQKTALPNVLPQMVHDRNNINKSKTCIVPARIITWCYNCQLLSNSFGGKMSLLFSISLMFVNI